MACLAFRALESNSLTTATSTGDALPSPSTAFNASPIFSSIRGNLSATSVMPHLRREENRRAILAAHARVGASAIGLRHLKCATPTELEVRESRTALVV